MFMMVGNSRMSTELLIPKLQQLDADENRHRNRSTGPTLHRNQMWIEPRSRSEAPVKVPVLYYLSRNGHLEHPHLIEVSPSSSSSSSSHGQQLYLRDVMNCLDSHRGKGFGNLYSWSYKRSYRSGFVWHDVSEEDAIHPSNGHDFVLKGEELLLGAACRSENPPEPKKAFDEGCMTSSAAMEKRMRNQSWSSFDNPHEYIVYKCESSRDFPAKFAADAATQTEEEKRRRRSFGQERSVVLSREEVSPPPSNSSSEVSDGVIGGVDRTAEIGDRSAEDAHPSGRIKASQVLMQLITCGTVSIKDQGFVASMEHGKD